MSAGSTSAGSTASGPRHLGGTMRRDAWWLELLPVVLLLGAFGIYATLRAFEGTYYEWGPYLSPFYSPLIDPHHRWWPLSPALLILIWPLGFRVTCYYYRKAYYRAFFLDPPACAVSESGKRHYEGHMLYAWISVITVGLTDLYVRLVASGAVRDLRLL